MRAMAPRVQPAQRDLIGIGISDTVEHHESRLLPVPARQCHLCASAEAVAGVNEVLGKVKEGWGLQ
jgi:hypothetical protein